LIGARKSGQIKRSVAAFGPNGRPIDMARQSWDELGGRMRPTLIGAGLAACLALATPAARAQDEGVFDSDYDASVEELPIESEVFDDDLTVILPQGGEISPYGQVNLTYQSFDDGDETTSGIVDNGNWNTRLGVTFTQPVGDSTLRLRFETGLGLRNSALVSQTFEPPVLEWNKIWLRWFELAAETPYGTISAGQGASASDGTSGLDDSFTFHAGAANSQDGFGAFQFRDDAGNLTGVTIGQVNNGFNGARRFRLRYDTPIFSGVMLSTSYGKNILVDADKNDYYDVAIRWTGEIGDVAIRSAAGYQWIAQPGGDTTERVAAAATAVHRPTGLNLNVSLGRQIDGASFYWVRAGWRTDPFAVGTTSLSADYYNGSDFLSDGARTENYGLYAVQSIDDASLDLYMSWRRFTYSDLLGNSYQDANGILVGARWFF
jgi:hypothetical protein